MSQGSFAKQKLEKTTRHGHHAPLSNRQKAVMIKQKRIEKQKARLRREGQVKIFEVVLSPLDDIDSELDA